MSLNSTDTMGQREWGKRTKPGTKAVIAVLVVLSLFSLPHLVEAQSNVIHSPIITSVISTPQIPPPGYPVNVTANVDAYPRSITQVQLIYYTSTNRINRTVTMVRVTGNETTGFFFGVIPSNVTINGAELTYVIVAIDSAGFVGVSDRGSFVVQPDRAPPTFAEHPAYGYLYTPIVNYTKVVVSFEVSDTGSGVKWVSVEYSNSTDRNHNLNNSINLTLAEGDRFDGLWKGTIPPLHNGTVLYEAIAADYAGNTGSSDIRMYQINPLSAFPPYAKIFVVVQNLNLTSRTMTTYFEIAIFYPSSYVPDNLNGYVDIEKPAFNVTAPIIPRESGFQYHKSYAQQIPIYDINLWPFDSYSLDMKFTIFDTPNLNSSNTQVEFFSEGLTQLQFDSSTPQAEITVNKPSGELQIHFHVDLTRKSVLVNPIMQAIYAVFFVLGSVALIRPGKIARRLEVFLGLFTFIVILFFTITPILQSERISNIIGPVLPQALLIGLTWSVVLLLAASLAVSYLLEVGWLLELSIRRRLVLRHIFNLSLAAIALYVTWYFGSVFVGFQSYIHFVFMIPQVRVAVIEGLFLPSVISMALDFFRA